MFAVGVCGIFTAFSQWLWNARGEVKPSLSIHQIILAWCVCVCVCIYIYLKSTFNLDHYFSNDAQNFQMECSLLMVFMKRTMLHKGRDWSFREVWRLWNITQIFWCCTVEIRCDTCKIIHFLQNPYLPVPENAGTLVRCYEYFIESQRYFI